MKKYLDVIKTVPLFKDIQGSELEAMLDCLGGETRTLRKGEAVLLAGGRPRQIGVVLSGLLHITREDYDGNETLIAAVSPLEIFGEAMCCAGVEESPVTILAADDAIVLLLRYASIVHVCQSACGCHQKLVENMLYLVASRNMYLQERLEIMSIKSVRSKVLRYLESLAAKQGRNIVVPFNKTKMAEYLCVERTALAHELARMRKDGLIEYRKNIFRLIA